jgi:membrane protein insertase Oxa1/YidC/SpoIIIJ
VVAFGDDLILMIGSDNISEAENIAKIKMEKYKLGRKQQNQINKEKSKVMIMTGRKRKVPKEVLVYINNKAIPRVEKLKYLGIKFDYKLLFREHTNYVADKCKKLIFQLAKVAKLNWGLSHKALQTIYMGGIQSLLIYGSPA